MSVWRIVGISFGALVLVLLLAFGLRGFGLVSFQFWGPKEENARREVFENTKSFNDGMAQELRNMQFQYVQAQPEAKAALRSIIIHRADTIPQENLPADLAAFINTLRHNEATP